MKQTLLTCLIFIIVNFYSEAQHKNKKEWQVDKFGFIASGSYGILPIQLSGLTDVGSKVSTMVGSQWVTERPEYAIKDTSALMMNGMVHLGINIPFYRTATWSFGAKVNAGIGFQRSRKAAEGLNGFVLDFPQFLYFRNYKNKLDYTILLGYKYTYAPLSYQLALGGIDFNLKHNKAIRLYGGLNEYKYYRYFTDGRTEPAFRLREFGLAYVASF